MLIFNFVKKTFYNFVISLGTNVTESPLNAAAKPQSKQHDVTGTPPNAPTLSCLLPGAPTHPQSPRRHVPCRRTSPRQSGARMASLPRTSGFR